MPKRVKQRYRAKKFVKLITSRLFITCFFILTQLVFLFLSMLLFWSNYPIFSIPVFILTLILIVVIVNDETNPTYKIAWLIPLLVFPVFGAPLYLVFSKNKVSKRVRKIFKNVQVSAYDIMPENTSITEELEQLDISIAKQTKYIHKTSFSPIFKNTQTKFLANGEDFFDALIEELKKAEKYIFLEYFIIDKGVMWESVLKILKKKASEGVEVKVLYDDLGTISLLPKDYPAELERYGIETCIFNQFRPSLDAFLNYRDHRKITVIDGNVGFTGGINLADEYINQKLRFGHWKDSSVMIKGDAVSSLTSTFLQLWYFTLQTSYDKYEYTKYMPTKSYESDGYVQPFSDGPISDNLTGELAYMHIINNARKSIKITTPYLVLDHEMTTAIALAAQSGIDVSIITPHIPDKWYVHDVSQSNYPLLLKAGVKIYEYTPGFIHSKTIVADDEVGIVGTVNFDFRSFYLHFENGIFMYKSKCVLEMSSDFDEVLNVCTQISLEDMEKVSKIKVLRQKVLRLFTPLI